MPYRTPEAFDASHPGPVAGPLGLILPTFPQLSRSTPTASELADTCTRAEAAGASALWACDHLYWHSPAIECLSAVTVAAMATERVSVGPCVLQLPLRRYSAVAKQAASIQDLSGGRLILGVGVGTHEGEYEAADADFHRRGSQLDEGIENLRKAWSSAHGEGRYKQLPAAAPIPIWVGGSAESALRRAARRGDGWIPLFLSPAEYSAGIERLEKEADRIGRDPLEVRHAIVVFAAIGGEDTRESGLAWMSSLYSVRAESFRRHIVSGDAKHCAQNISTLIDAGAEHVAVFVTHDQPLSQFEDLAGELREMRELKATPA